MLDYELAGAAFGTTHSGSILLDVLALWIVRTGSEWSVAPMLEHQRLAALGTRLFYDGIGRSELATRLNLSASLALGITGARQELPESAALHRHGLSAVLAHLLRGFCVSLFVALGNIASRFARSRLCLSSRRRVFSGLR